MLARAFNTKALCEALQEELKCCASDHSAAYYKLENKESEAIENSENSFAEFYASLKFLTADNLLYTLNDVKEVTNEKRFYNSIKQAIKRNGAPHALTTNQTLGKTKGQYVIKEVAAKADKPPTPKEKLEKAEADHAAAINELKEQHEAQLKEAEARTIDINSPEGMVQALTSIANASVGHLVKDDAEKVLMLTALIHHNVEKSLKTQEAQQNVENSLPTGKDYLNSLEEAKQRQADYTEQHSNTAFPANTAMALAMQSAMV